MKSLKILLNKLSKNMKLSKSKKLIFAFSLVAALSFGTGVLAADGVKQVTAYLHPDISVSLDGVRQNLKDDEGKRVYPLLYNDTTYLPLRAVANTFGKDVDWDGTNKTVVITTPDSGDQSEDAMKDNITYSSSYDIKYISLGDITKTTGHLTNNTGYNVKYIVIEATYYNAKGRELGTGTGFANNVNNGSRTAFDVVSSGDYSAATEVKFTTKICY